MKTRFFTLLFLLISPSVWAFSLQDLSQVLQKPQHIQGEFMQTRQLQNSAMTMKTNGKFVLIPKRGLLWHTQKPFDNRLRVRAEGMMQWNGQNWLAHTRKTGQTQQIQLFLDLLGGNAQGLEKQFDLSLTGQANQWRLQLNPKSMIMKKIFQSIEIKGNSVVTQIVLHEKQGDRTTMDFQRIQTNTPLDEFAQKHLK